MTKESQEGESSQTRQKSNIKLHHATADGNTLKVEALLKQGLDVNAVAKLDAGLPGEYTPLGRAIELNSEEIVQVLLNYRADLELFAFPSKHCTPLYVATWRNYINIVRILLQEGCDSTKRSLRNNSAFEGAVMNQCIDTAELLIEYGADINEKYSNDWTLLHLAADGGCSEMVKFLLDSGASVDPTIKKGGTPSMLASRRDDTTTMALLINKGSDVNLQDKYGWTAIFYAAYFGSVNALKFLISQKADFKMTASDGSTPLKLTAQEGHVQIVTLLLETGTQVDYCDDRIVLPCTTLLLKAVKKFARCCSGMVLWLIVEIFQVERH